jgi:hypothetical protein
VTRVPSFVKVLTVSRPLSTSMRQIGLVIVKMVQFSTHCDQISRRGYGRQRRVLVEPRMQLQCMRSCMRKQTPLIAFAACIATLSSIGIPTAQAKQKCSGAMPSNPQGYWSWRLIDGRKCWYEGKPMLSRSSLEWPAQASAQPNIDGELTSVLPEKPGNPLDSQAWAPNDSHTFETRWRAIGMTH